MKKVQSHCSLQTVDRWTPQRFLYVVHAGSTLPGTHAWMQTVSEYHQLLAAKEQLEIRLATNMDEVRRAIQDKSNAVRELYHEQQALLTVRSCASFLCSTRSCASFGRPQNELKS